ncbi:MAG: PTS sugar transporter subunit IIA [Fusobacteriota bacterium]
MKLSSYLDPKLIFTDIKSCTKDDAIKELISKISKEDETIKKNYKLVEKAILDREHEISTAMGHKIAIPHARIEGIDDLIVGVGITEDPIKCEIINTKVEDNVDIFFIIIAGKTKNKLTLKMMSAITKLAQKDEVIKEIEECKDSNNIFKLIKDSEIEVNERITAKDVMQSDIESVKLTDTLEEVAKRLTIENVTGLPVVDQMGKFVGEITERELIEYGMPKYTSVMKNLSFMTIGEPFKEYFEKESEVKVEELYRENPITIDRKASIMEVSFIMVTKGITRLYVVEDNKYYGVIFRSALIKKVLHI